MASATLFEAARPVSDFEAEQRSARANRRRLVVFLSVFLTVALAGLGYVYSRPAVYEASARLKLVVPEAQRSASEPAGEAASALRDELQFLTSRTLLATVGQRLQTAPGLPPSVPATDLAASLQAMLGATPLDGSSVVLLRARGGEPEFLSRFLDALLAAYRQSLAERNQGASASALADARDEARKLEAGLLAKRREVDAFRARHHIVSLERDENQVLAEVKGAGEALNAANEKAVAAQARLDALQEAAAAGRSVARSRDNPTLAAIEQEAASVRADLKEFERRFTPQYMRMDPYAKALQERLVELERQVAAQRQSSQQDALQEARDELASARAAVARLRQQVSTNQASVQAFTSRFNEYRALQDELNRVEQLRQQAVERLAALEAQATTRTTRVEVLEPAATDRSPVSPAYARDAAVAVAGALLAALLAVGLVELFNRPPRQPPMIVMPQSWVPVPVGSHAPASLGATAPKALADERPPPALPTPLPRELSDAELQALLGAADRDLRAAMALLSTGLTAREVVALRCGDVDRDAGCVRVSEQRTVALPATVLALLPNAERPADAPLLARGNWLAFAESDLDAAVLYAAHDAGLDHPGDVGAASLRHTYLAFLVRQGIRFSDLAGLVGPLPPEALAAYSLLAPAGARRPPGDIERVLPALRVIQ